MIEFLEGRLVEKNPGYVVVSCNGVGYFVNISLNTFSSIGDDEAVKIFTHLAIREDAHILYGFSTTEERTLFRQLISVSGVGTSTAQVLLSSLPADQLTLAIINSDVNLLKSVKGIGAKTAQRIIVDLKDKLSQGEKLSEKSFTSYNTNRNEALSALSALGFDNKRSVKVIDAILKDKGDMPVEDLVKAALQKL